VSRLRRFIQATIQELRKVTWPTPQQARNLTVVVLVVSAAVGAYIAVFDYVFLLISNAIIAQ
jgi:preprotein translocase subunit SecE